MIHIAGKSYEIVKEYRNAFNGEAFRNRYSEVLERYDYIVGDWGYNQLRLRGFFKESNPKSTKETTVALLQDYIQEYCNFGCSYFVLEKVADRPQAEGEPAGEPALEEGDIFLTIPDREFVIPEPRVDPRREPRGEGRDDRNSKLGKDNRQDGGNRFEAKRGDRADRGQVSGRTDKPGYQQRGEQGQSRDAAVRGEGHSGGHRDRGFGQQGKHRGGGKGPGGNRNQSAPQTGGHSGGGNRHFEASRAEGQRGPNRRDEHRYEGNRRQGGGYRGQQQAGGAQGGTNGNGQEVSNTQQNRPESGPADKSV